MSTEYSEKISCLYAVSDSNGPLAFITAPASSGFPVSKSLTLRLLFFDFRLDTQYIINTKVFDENKTVFVDTDNYFQLDSNALTIPAYQGLGSSLITIETPVINFLLENKIYTVKVTAAIQNEDGQNQVITENQTYVRTRNE